MNLDLKGFRESKQWKKNLNGFINIGKLQMRDFEVRIIVERGIAEGYETLHDIPDEIAKKWIEEVKEYSLTELTDGQGN